MIHVKAPNQFLEEREYLCSIIFQKFIGIEYSVTGDATLRDIVELEFDNKKILIADHFFSKTTTREGYLKKELIPAEVPLVTSDFLHEKDIPLLFGNAEISTSEDSIACGQDIFASIFFMLTRWEEVVIKEYDYLARFPAKASLAYKHNFLHRPVVNEWIELLKNMIRHLSPGIRFSKRQSHEIVFTHDIDLLNAPVSIREFAKDAIKRRSGHAAITRLGYLIKGKNPYNVFDFFMDISEKNNTLSRFYFMTGHNVVGKDGEPYNNTPLYKRILSRIKERGHIIGFHPSLLSYNKPEMFKKEKKQLEQDIDDEVVEGRQHALRFSIPETWSIWENEGMKLDSTMGYSAMEGFRCGTGNKFPVFDVVNRKALKLEELPLVVMDTTLHVNRKLGIEESKNVIKSYIETGKEYDMPITLLFHNLIDDSIDWQGWKELYDELFGN